MSRRVRWPVLLAVIVVGGLLYALRPVFAPPVAEGDRRPQPGDDLFDPRAEQVTLPAGYRPSLGRDVIAPIYDPRFVPADAVDWAPETLVLGVAIDDEAKAYPVNVLNFREIVIDRLRGIPLLVSW